MSGGVESASSYYDRWLREVSRSVPASRLLIHRPEDGWGPLCRFLSLPEPPELLPYPRVNATRQMEEQRRRTERTAGMWMAAAAAAAIMLVAASVYRLRFKY